MSFYSAVAVSVKDKLTLSLGVAVGSSIVSCRWLVYLYCINRMFIANSALCHSVRFPYHSSTLNVLTAPSFIVTLAWIMGKPLTLLFDPYESVALFLAGDYSFLARFASFLTSFSVLTVNYVVQDGKSNWLEGMILMCRCSVSFCVVV